MTTLHEATQGQAVKVREPQAERPSLIRKFAGKFSIDPAKLMDILKATAFKQRDGKEPTDEQMAALLVVADQYGLNPFTKEIFAFPDKQSGIIPVVGVDGWSRIINEHPQADGIEFRQSDEMVQMPDAKPCPAWIECVIYRKDRKHETAVREYLDETYRPPFATQSGNKISGPWQTHTKRLLRHKSLIQAGRIVFGFAGIYDEDEAARIIEGQVVDVPAEPAKSGTAALRVSAEQAARYAASNLPKMDGAVVDERSRAVVDHIAVLDEAMNEAEVMALKASVPEHIWLDPAYETAVQRRLEVLRQPKADDHGKR